FLPGSAFTGDEHRGVRTGNLLGELDHFRHGVVAVDHLARIVGDGGKHGSNQIRIGRQRDVFFGAGMYGIHCRARIVGDAARDDRHVDMFGIKTPVEVAYVEADVHHQKVGAASGAQNCECLIVTFGVGDASALFHCKFGCGAELAAERADNEKSHGLAPCHSSSGGWASHQLWSALMISVMVTPSLSSTSTTSPRATSRL